MAEPRGPVYLTLPRETLSEEAEVQPAGPVTRVPAPRADPGAVAKASELLAEAKRPLVITASFGRTPEDREVLAALSSRHHVAVTTERPRIMPIVSDHPGFIGFEPARHVADADLILALCCDVPWIPRNASPNGHARVVHIGHDPLFSRYPIRTHRADLALDGDPTAVLRQLLHAPSPQGEVAAERSRWVAGRRADFEKLRGREVSFDGTATYAAVARALSSHLRPGDVIVCETAFPAELLDLPEGVSLFGAPSAGGLGWGLGAALGAKLAAPERRVIALVGDGAYMFGNPTPAHFVAAAEGLPFLTIILNNEMWAAVRRATLAVYPDSVTRNTGGAVFTSLQPSPAYERVVEASDGLGECVTSARDIAAALERAFAGLDAPGRQAVLNVLVE